MLQAFQSENFIEQIVTKRPSENSFFKRFAFSNIISHESLEWVVQFQPPCFVLFSIVISLVTFRYELIFKRDFRAAKKQTDCVNVCFVQKENETMQKNKRRKPRLFKLKPTI